MPNLTTAYQWLVGRCNAANVGYSMNYREQQTVDGITYYDCSSILWYALVAGGWPLVGSPFTTDTMRNILTANGWQEVDINGNWVAGDIVWRPAGYAGHEYGHCEMVYTGGVASGITMGAHSSNLPLADQVSINSGTSAASSYRSLFRYTGGGVVGRQWYIDPDNYSYFTTEQQQNNALCLRDWFVTNTDWTLQAIAGMAANVEGESQFNPNAWENPSIPIGTVNRDGIGLVQWTTSPGMTENPLVSILKYLYGTGKNWNLPENWRDPEKQCASIMAEYNYCRGAIQTTAFEAYWRRGGDYNLTFEQWAHSTADPGYLALHFQYSYERPASLHPEREGWGRKWYQYFLDNPYTPTPWTPRKGLKIWQMIRYHI